MKNTLLLIFAFLLSEFYNVAVSQDFAFYNINNLSGISMREVTAVVRDDDGFVWAASRTGVLRVATDDYQLYSLPFTTTDVMQIKMALKFGCLLLGMGLGLLTGYMICVTTVPDYFTERNWHMSELTSLIYGANVLLFGGLGLVVAFIVELKISQKNRKDHTR